MAILCVNVVTVCMLLSVLFVSGVWTDCKTSDLFITAPKKMEALTGSCLQIPCSFRFPDPEQKFDSSSKIFGVWLKDSPHFADKPDNVIFNSSRQTNNYSVNITGNLHLKNCTTLFSRLFTNYTNSYYFRIENNPLMATAACDRLEITERDSPWRPTVEISGVLKEEESVTVTCSALTPCPHSPPKLTWNLQQDSHNRMEENVDGTFMTKIQTTITLSDQHDGNNISCSAAYPVNEGVKTAEEMKTLNVSYAPKNTSISPSGPVSAGSWVNLTCTSRANPPVSRFIWFKRSKDGAKNVSEGQFYSFNLTEGVYYCVAINNLGNQTSQNLTFGASFQFLLHVAVVGSIVALICLSFCVWQFKFKHQSLQQTQSGGDTETALQMQPGKADEQIHYEEIVFARSRAEPSSDPAQAEEQETLYAQVKPRNGSNQAADGREDLYAQVKKK